MSRRHAVVDLLCFSTLNGRVLIAPISGRGRLALRQLLDSSMPRIGDALLLLTEQAEGICRFLGSLSLAVRPWSFRLPAAAPLSDLRRPRRRAAPPAPPSAPLTLAQRLSAQWGVMSLRQWRALHSVLTLQPGGQLMAIPLPLDPPSAARSAVEGGDGSGTTQQCTSLVPCTIPMNTISPPPTDTPPIPPAAPLPAWVVSASPEIEITVVGINPLGELYIYGASAERPGPRVPAIVGVVGDVRISQHGASSRYGLRDYLDLHLATPIPAMKVILRLPCKANPQPGGAQPLIPWSVRSLLGALQAIDLQETALKLQTRRGNTATFFRVIPFSPEGIEQAEIRAAAIGGSRDDLEIAVNHLRAQLQLPPAFPAPVKDTGR